MADRVVERVREEEPRETVVVKDRDGHNSGLVIGLIVLAIIILILIFGGSMFGGGNSGPSPAPSVTPPGTSSQ